MKQVDYLQKLLNGVDVEWKMLGEVVEIADRARKPIKASLRTFGNTPYYGANNIQDYVDGYTHNGEYVLIAEDGASRLDSYTIQWATGKFWANNHVHVIRGKKDINNRFLYFYLKTISFIPFITGGIRAKLTKSKMQQIPIPIPPLSIQKEIVRILDAFAELTNELTNELTMRQQQYNHYRDTLLDFSDKDVEWKTLGEVFHMQAGKHISSIEIMSNSSKCYPYPCFGGNGVRGFVKHLNRNGDYLIIGRQGALCGNVKRIKGKFYATEHAIVVTPNNKIDIDWAFHMLTVMNLNQYASKSAQPGLAAKKLQELYIPVPSLKNQKQIAAFLDKFDTLTNSISAGLPREIELRQKQYAYYRNLLLNFPKPDSLVL